MPDTTPPPDPVSSPDMEVPPPIGRTWNRLYAAVILNLVLLVAIFYAFTKAFQ